MASKWLNKKTAMVANTVYCDKQLVARDVEFTLPEVTYLSSEVQAAGTLELPIVGATESMELSITKIGFDTGLKRMTAPKKMSLEFRTVQSGIDKNGNSTNESIKIFVSVIPKTIPGFGIKVGENSENEITYSVTRYSMFINGVEYLLIDKLSGIFRINGTDYAAKINKLL